MRRMKFLPALIVATLLIAVMLYVAFYFVFLDFFIDLWWFESLKLAGYFWLKVLYKFLLSGAVTLVFFSIFFLHFWIASRYLGLNPPDEVLRNADKFRRFQAFSDAFMGGSLKIYTPIALVLAIIIAVPFYQQWETSLLYFFGSDSGVKDAVYGNDVSFYLLSYPLYSLIQQELLITSTLTFLLVGLQYWLEHIFVPNQRREYPLGAKIHLTVLISFVFAFVVWGFMLKRFGLLYTNSHEPIFYGPGFVEIRYQLPLIWLGIGTFLATVVSAGLFIFSGKYRRKLPFLLSLSLFVIVLFLPKLTFIPDAIQRFVVNPNPVKMEKPFIQHNIDATLNAYDLNHIKTEEISIKLDALHDIEQWGNQKHFDNIPVWDREYLIDSYRQLQEIRPYYKITAVDEDRYFINGHVRQVNLAAREINTSKLPREAQNWENIHMRYTHGYGAVMSPAAQEDGDSPLGWYLRDLNLSSPVGLTVKYPDIYYGLEHYDYAIVPNNLQIADIAGSTNDPGMAEPYHGQGGVAISSYFRKLLFAIHFRDEKLFFSTNVSTQSKLKIHRNISEAIHKITPFLHLDKDAYLVVTDDRFYWIQDAYTLSNGYPAAKPAADDFLEGHQQFNYIRNSVKIVVDAFDGDVMYYIAEPSDVIIQAYSKAYPGVFKTLDQMPIELLKHLRYPRDLYTLQMKVYAKYHQSKPELFYEQAETWEFADVRDKPVLPYYQTMDFGHCNGSEEFVLINPMTPVNRNNLSMIGMASTLDKTNCTASYKPNITVYKFGRDVQVDGPAQLEAIINQDPDISELITLWDQHGSTVEFGRMVILPMLVPDTNNSVAHNVLYVHPVYVSSTKNSMPELTRVIVSVGDEVVMEKNFWDAFNRLKRIYQQKALGKTATSTAPVIPALEQKP